MRPGRPAFLEALAPAIRCNFEELQGWRLALPRCIGLEALDASQGTS